MANFDILGQTLLKDLKKHFKQFEYAVIAGGMVRDHELGADWKDIDIFVPYRGNSFQLEGLLQKIVLEGKSFGLTLNPEVKDKERNRDYKFIVSEWLYHDAISVQIMFINDVGDVNFPNRLLETFHYGVDRAYYDGNEIHFSEEFKKDKKTNTATLVKLDYIFDLPEAMKKFYRIKEKYPKIQFNCDVIQMKKKENPTYLKGIESIYEEFKAAAEPGILFIEEAPPARHWANPAGEQILDPNAMVRRR